MIILAVDTSSPSGSIALIREDLPLEEINLHTGKAHSESLLPSIYYILKDTGIFLEEVDLFAVTVGPGSFTGLRVGISTVKGLAWALRRPVVGVSTLSALASNLPFAEGPVCPIMDARKGEVYTAIFRAKGGRLKQIMDDRALKPEVLVKAIGDDRVIFLGDGIPVYGEILKKGLGKRAIFTSPYLWSVRASVVGTMAFELFNQGKAEDPESLFPRYLRPSEAELRWRKD